MSSHKRLYILKNYNNPKINYGLTDSKYTWLLSFNFLLRFTITRILPSAALGSEWYTSTLTYRSITYGNFQLGTLTLLKRSFLVMKIFSSFCICFGSCEKSNTWSLFLTQEGKESTRLYYQLEASIMSTESTWIHPVFFLFLRGFH